MLRSFSPATAAALVAFCIALSGASYSQNSAGPQPVPLPPPVSMPVDKPYEGTISQR